MRLGIVNRFPASGAYSLGEALAACGVDVVRFPVAELGVDARHSLILTGSAPPAVDAVLWRLSENLWPSVSEFASLVDIFVAPTVNRPQSLALCADKRLTAIALERAGVPAIESWTAAPGSAVSFGCVAKPAFGAGGRDVIFGDETSCIPSDAREPWVIQRRLPPHFVRALIVYGQVICSYERENDPGLPNNIEAGGRRVFRRLTASERDLALAAAEAVGTVISGVDLAVDDLAVLEVNGSPGLPPEFVRKTAEVAAAFLLRA